MTRTPRAKFSPRPPAPSAGLGPIRAGPWPRAHRLALWGSGPRPVPAQHPSVGGGGARVWRGGSPLHQLQGLPTHPFSLGVSALVSPADPYPLLCPPGPPCAHVCVSWPHMPPCVPWSWVGLPERAAPLAPPAAPFLPHSVIYASLAGDRHGLAPHSVPKWRAACLEPSARLPRCHASTRPSPSHGSHSAAGLLPGPTGQPSRPFSGPRGQSQGQSRPHPLGAGASPPTPSPDFLSPEGSG